MRNKGFIGLDWLLSPSRCSGDKSQSRPINPLFRKSECNNLYYSSPVRDPGYMQAFFGRAWLPNFPARNLVGFGKRSNRNFSWFWNTLNKKNDWMNADIPRSRGCTVKSFFDDWNFFFLNFYSLEDTFSLVDHKILSVWPYKGSPMNISFKIPRIWTASDDRRPAISLCYPFTLQFKGTCWSHYKCSLPWMPTPTPWSCLIMEVHECPHIIMKYFISYITHTEVINESSRTKVSFLSEKK